MTNTLNVDWIAVLVAAGRGTRALPNGQDGTVAPAKQYRRIAGKSVLARGIGALLATDGPMRVLPVIHPDDDAEFVRVIEELSRSARDSVLPPVHGGASRQDSVFRGLQYLKSALSGADPIVFIHDAARPFLSPGLILRLSAALERSEGAVPALPVTDTLKRANASGLVEGDIDRGTAFAVQTPQVFRLNAIHAAHVAAIRDGASSLTDDAAVATRAGLSVALVEGEHGNIKLTHDEDFAFAQRGFQEPDVMETRVGQGFDVHRLGPGDRITLGGIRIPHDGALIGHSDADVGLHAITDALLGAVAAGDIGSHFPPSNPRWKGADSTIFLEEAIRLVRKDGGEIRFIDLTFACERPRIGPHRNAMRARIADLLGIAVERVSVKATTTEQLGFTGRGEGIAAYAAATIALPATGDGNR